MQSDYAHIRTLTLDDFKEDPRPRITTREESIENLYEEAERGGPRERDRCLRTLTKIPDPLIKEKIAFLREVLSSGDDDNPKMRGMIETLCVIRIRTVIPLVHLLRIHSSPALDETITRLLVQMGDVAIEPIIQLFRYGDEAYYASVLPVLKSLTPSSGFALRDAQRSEEIGIRWYATQAIRALQGPYRVPEPKRNIYPEGTTVVGGREYDTLRSLDYGSFCAEHYDELYDLVE